MSLAAAAVLVVAAAVAAPPDCPFAPQVHPPAAVKTLMSVDGHRVAAQGRMRLGRRHGLWCHYDSDGHLIIEESYKAGLLDGRRIQFGEHRLERTWSDGTLDGPSRAFRYGTLVSEGSWARGKKEGAWTEADLLGPRASGGYVDGEREGRWTIELREGGRLEVEYRAGLYHGVAVEYGPRGDLVRELSYEQARVRGPARIPEGEGWAEGELVGEQRQGDWVFTDARGERVAWGAYVDGEREGPWVELRGAERREGAWSAGLEHGLFTVSIDGALSSRTLMAAGQKDGPSETWDEAGTLRQLIGWTAGRMDGSYGIWTADGSLVALGAHEGGARVGVWTERVQDGVWTGAYSAGLKVGLWRLQADGQLLEEAPHRAGHLEGSRLRWTADGTMVERCEHRSGRKHGPCESWRTDGSPEVVARYADGHLDGQLRRWDRSGTLVEESSWQAGQLHGPCRFWTEEGDLLQDAGYAAGQLHGDFRLLEGEVVMREGRHDDGREVGIWIERHADGRLASRCGHDDEGDLHGLCETWFAGGGRQERSSWVNGSRDGDSTLWWADGGRWEQGTWADGRREGEWRFWHRGGARSKVGAYVGGLEDGEWSFYDRRGRLERQAIYAGGAVVATRQPGERWQPARSMGMAPKSAGW
jgi:uncharacterized protein